MIDIEILDKYFKEYTQNINDHLPEGIVEVDLALLQKYNILDLETNEKDDASVTRFFHMLESDDRVTLVNEEFVIWIVPDHSEMYASTYLFIALNNEGIPELETGFKASGVYNVTPRILHLLEHMLVEIQENEEILSKFTNN